MGNEGEPRNRRILVVDDNKGIHDDFRRILGGEADTAEIDDMASALFETTVSDATKAERFEITSAYQGEEGLDLVRDALRRGRPFALVFVDVRMPPGWDGVEALARFWREDPSLQAVICSAYSDYGLNDINAALGRTDRLLILRKPFEPIEAYQMAYALTEKWNQQRGLAAARERIAAQLEALARSEANTRALLDAIPDALLRFDAAGTCVDFKAPNESAPHPQRGAPLGEHLTALFPPAVAAEALRHVERADGGDSTAVLEFEEPSSGGARDYEARIVRRGALDAVVLVRDVTERRSAEAEAKARQVQAEVIRAQAEILASLSSPMIPISEDIVVVPIIGELDAPLIGRVQEVVVRGMAERRARTAILDLTGVARVTDDVSEALLQIARAVRLVGAEVIVTGMRPEVAQTLVRLGTSLSGIATTRTLQSGIAFAMERRGGG